MGDDDVICLSSDDEIAENELPIKKQRLEGTLLIAKIEPKEIREKPRVTFNLKRKNSDDSLKSDETKRQKKAKIGRSNVEEITIESPSKDVNGKAEVDGAIVESDGKCGQTARKDLTSKGITSDDELESSSTNVPTSPFFSKNSVDANSDGSKKFDASKSRNSTKVREGLPSRVLNPVAKLRIAEKTNRSTSPTSSKNGIVEREKKRERKTSVASSTSEETAKSTNENIETVVPSSVKIADDLEISKSDTAKINEEISNETSPKKSEFSGTNRQTCESPELLIIGSPETKDPSKNVEVESHSSVSNDDSSKSTERRSPNIEKLKNSNGDDVKKKISSRAENWINGIEETTTRLSLSATEMGDVTESSPKPNVGDEKTRTKNDDSARKRLTPKQLSGSIVKSLRSESDVEKSSKSSEDSKESAVKKTNNDDKSENSRSMNSDSIVSSESQSLKNDKKSDENSIVDEKSFSIESRAGCSTSLPENREKPLLVVVQKKPLSHDEKEDTFSMFLSLCLQTDRCPDMERIVAKLKRYYEQLNPAYAASEAFRDNLNEKREIITEKGKKVVYHYVQLLQKDMKARRKKSTDAKTKEKDTTTTTTSSTGTKSNEDEERSDEVEEDSDEARRKRQKVKKIQKAMNECQRMIKKYEEAEIDFDDENNSHYIKLDRFKERMVELYTQMCKYTDDHPDAGRSYLRPKHLRVTQIPSIDQAINSFVNSKLSFNNRRVTKGKSFVDGLVFPDYVDILECVEKVNKEQKLKLDKRAMSNLAAKAFTQLGKHLQEARQNDYWDTFSLNLENNVDPASSDADLIEKLAENRKIAEINERKVFEKFVKKQEERKSENKDESPSEDEEDEEEDEDSNEEDEEDVDDENKSDNGKKTNDEISNDDDEDDDNADDDEKIEKSTKERKSNGSKSFSEVSPKNDEKITTKDDDKKISGKDLQSDEPMADEKSSGKDAETIEVILDDVDTEEVDKNGTEDEKFLPPLRIRSFAKQPETWQSSQDFKEETNENKPETSETSESTEDEITVVSYLPAREKFSDEKFAPSSLRSPSLMIKNSPNSVSDSSIAKNPKYSASSPIVGRSLQPTIVNPRKIVRTVEVSKLTHPEISLISRRPFTVKPITVPVPIPIKPKDVETSEPKKNCPMKISTTLNSTSLTVQRIQSTPEKIPNSTVSRLPLKQTNQLQIKRLQDGKIVASNLKLVAAPPSVQYQIQMTRGGISHPSTSISGRTNQNNANKVMIPPAKPSAQSSPMQLVRTNTGKYVTVPVMSMRNSRNLNEQIILRNNNLPQRK